MSGGLIAYKFGKRLGDGSFQTAYHLNQPPRVLRTAVSSLRAAHETGESLVPNYLISMLQNISAAKRAMWKCPGQDHDVCFPTTYPHQGGQTCAGCNTAKGIWRKPRGDTDSVTHYGTIATGTEVVKYAPTRDEIKDKHHAICLEMELTHMTVKEYLMCLSPDSVFHPVANSIISETMLATVCMRYLSEVDENGTQAHIHATLPLASYACKFWARHAYQTDHLPQVTNLSLNFLSNDRTRRIWSLLYNPDYPWEDRPEPYAMAPLLYYASLYGLVHTIKTMLDTGAEPSGSGGRFHNALQTTCLVGFEPIVELLLSYGAEVNAIGGLHNDAL